MEAPPMFMLMLEALLSFILQREPTPLLATSELQEALFWITETISVVLTLADLFVILIPLITEL
jgi:hypothetical protein